MAQQCRDKEEERSAEFEAPPIDPALRAALDEFVTMRQDEISPEIA